MIVDAIKRANSTDGTKMAAALATIKNLKVTSGPLTIDPKTHDPLDKPAVIQKVDVATKSFPFVKKFYPGGK
jgi:branched-chain amino acid transport system substrate-binding protein